MFTLVGMTQHHKRLQGNIKFILLFINKHHFCKDAIKVQERQVIPIWAVTGGTFLTFCCGTCDVFTLVGMTQHYIYIILMLRYKRLQGNIKFI